MQIDGLVWFKSFMGMIRVSLAAWSTDTALEELNKIHEEETLCYFKTVCY